MKITLDKETISLAKKDEALRYAADNTWIDKQTLTICANEILRKYYDNQCIQIEEIVSMPKLEVMYYTLDGFHVYANDMIVKYWHKTPEDQSPFGDKMAILGFTVDYVLEGTVGAFIQVFGNTASRVIE